MWPACCTLKIGPCWNSELPRGRNEVHVSCNVVNYGIVQSLRTGDVSEWRSTPTRPPCSTRPRPFQRTHALRPASTSHSGSSQPTPYVGSGAREPDCRAHAPCEVFPPTLTAHALPGSGPALGRRTLRAFAHPLSVVLPLISRADRATSKEVTLIQKLGLLTKIWGCTYGP